ncbi:unnamed protein product [Gadus morhua 'NCC']
MRQQQQQGHRTIQISCREMNRSLSMFLLLLLLLLLLPLPLPLSLPLAMPLPQDHRAGGREPAGRELEIASVEGLTKLRVGQNSSITGCYVAEAVTLEGSRQAQLEEHYISTVHVSILHVKNVRVITVHVRTVGVSHQGSNEDVERTN